MVQHKILSEKRSFFLSISGVNKFFLVKTCINRNQNKTLLIVFLVFFKKTQVAKVIL
jgi:hypothetical protein